VLVEVCRQCSKQKSMQVVALAALFLLYYVGVLATTRTLFCQHQSIQQSRLSLNLNADGLALFPAHPPPIRSHSLPLQLPILEHYHHHPPLKSHLLSLSTKNYPLIGLEKLALLIGGALSIRAMCQCRLPFMCFRCTSRHDRPRHVHHHQRYHHHHRHHHHYHHHHTCILPFFRCLLPRYRRLQMSFNVATPSMMNKKSFW
jgi:hypothetical protein